MQQRLDPLQIPISLYIHMPWCVKKCPYCDFNSHTLQQELPEQQYVDALLKDLHHDLNFLSSKQRPLKSIFIGGGTPSLFSPASYTQLLLEISRCFTTTDAFEVTLEANPGTLESGLFAGYRQAGINRLSIGIQSFSETHLKTLGRIHNRQHAINAIEAAIASGYERYNVDIMFGLPQQTQQQALEDLSIALAFNPPHLSWYQLTLEPNTYFYRYPPTLPNDETLWEMQQAGQQLLFQAGLKQYEVSAYAKPGQECRHNLNYWQYGDYLGIGAGAHSKITTETGILRLSKYKNPRDYLNSDKPYIQTQQLLADSNKRFEFFLNSLRLFQPIAKTLFTQRTGLNWQNTQAKIATAVELGLLTETETSVTATTKGKQYLNDLIEIFID